MPESRGESFQRMKRVILESEKYIELLCMAPCSYSKNIFLTKLRCNMVELNRLCITLSQQASQSQDNSENVPQRKPRQRNFTLEELSNYTGKDGNPAYVAVNGVVYDVTNNAAWAAATHFGLSAGKDLSGAFASCHAGQTILSKLNIVGKLI